MTESEHGAVMSPSESMTFIRRLGHQLQSTPNPHALGLAHAQVLVADELTMLAEDGLTPELLLELERRVVDAVEQANSAFLRFDLRDVDSASEWNAVVLAAGSTVPGLSEEASTRKLVIVIPLAFSTEGLDGEIVFEAAKTHRAVPPGKALIFPAFMVPEFSVHGTGQIDALVAYAYGPAFR